MKKSFLSLLLCLMLLPVSAAPPRVLILGDSLSTGFGIDQTQAWVPLLQSRLAQEKFPHQVINASITGETTRGARDRAAALLSEYQPQLLILELGGNDGLRGISLDEMRANLSSMIELALKQGAEVMLVQMRLPPNYGSVYVQRFEAIYPALAEQHNISLSPFILKEIAENPELMQDDGIHPKAAAQAQILENLWDCIVAILSSVDAAHSGGDQS